jgi:hypothetical protein
VILGSCFFSVAFRVAILGSWLYGVIFPQGPVQKIPGHFRTTACPFWTSEFSVWKLFGFVVSQVPLF